MKILLITTRMNNLKSKQLLNFHNTLFTKQNGFNNKPNLPLNLRQWNEMNKCLSKFYASVRRKDGTFYKRNSLLSVRAKQFTDA